MIKKILLPCILILLFLTACHKKEETIFTNPGGMEGERVQFNATIDEDPVPMDGLLKINVTTDKDEHAVVLYPEGNVNFEWGDYVYISGEVSGMTKWKKKDVPLIDDATVEMGVEYEHFEDKK